MKMTIGLDIGGTKIEGALVRWDYSEKSQVPTPEIMDRQRVPTERILGAKNILEKLQELVMTLLKEHDQSIDEVEGIGLGLPGSVDPHSKQMIQGNTGVLVGIDMAQELKKLLGKNIPCFIDNDANLFAMAETYFGRGLDFLEESQIHQKNQLGIGIILGTGVGGGLVINGQIMNGHGGGGGEIGHYVLDSKGPFCYCGRRGCAEQFLSGPAIEGNFSKRLSSEFYESQKTSAEIFHLASESHPTGLAVVHEYQFYLERFLTDLTNIFSPHYFVLGGGVSQQPIIYQDIENKIKQKCFLKKSSPKVYSHKLGNSAGVIGASFLPLL